MRPEDEDVGDVVRRLAPADKPAGDGCPDANALAAFAEGRSPAAERDLVEAHLGTCAPCRGVLREASLGLASTGAAPSSAGAPSLARRVLPLAVAAVVLVGLGALAWRTLTRPSDDDVEPEATLAFGASTLRSERPDLFSGFAPLSAEEIAAVSSGRTRGWGVVRPAEVVRAGPSSVEWTPAPGATAYEVAVAGPDGRTIWRRSVGNGTTLDPPADAPPLGPGAHVVTVTARGPLGRDEATRRFTVASRDEEARLSEGLAEIERLAPRPGRSLLAAHWALRRGFVIEAERLLRERPPDRWDATARELLRHARRRLGAADDE